MKRYMTTTKIKQLNKHVNTNKSHNYKYSDQQ